MKDTIIYIGKDEDFYVQLDMNFSVTKSDEHIKQVRDYNPGTILTIALSPKTPIIFLVDFTSLDKNQEEALLNEVIYLKQIDSLKSILFISIFGELENNELLQVTLTSGFQLSFIKGCDLDVLIKNSLYIEVQGNNFLPDFARSKVEKKSMTIGLCSTLSTINNEGFLLESDLELRNEALEFKFTLFDGYSGNRFEHEKVENGYSRYTSFYTYMMKFPFAGAWDETSITETVQKDTVMTWVDLNKDTLLAKPSVIRIFSSNLELASIANNIRIVYPDLSVEFATKLTPQNLHSLSVVPQIIFIDNISDDTETSFAISNYIQTHLSSSDTKTIIIITNSPSSATAWQKVLNYKSIIATSSPLDAQMLELFSNKTSERLAGRSDTDDNYYFRSSDKRRCIDVEFQAEVTSITENDFTFFTEHELPMFTVLHLRLPIDCFATLVPSKKDLRKREGYNHYQGILHGASEEQLQNLRKFVNQIMHTKEFVFTQEDVTRLIKQELKKGLKQPEAEVVEKTLITQESPKDTADIGKKTRVLYKGKSKL